MEFNLNSKSNANSDFMKNLLENGKNMIEKIHYSKIVPYENQPFKPYSKERLFELSEDIKENGLLSPVIVRPMADSTYQILAGHNRFNACRLANIDLIPCFSKNVDDVTASLIVVNSNLNQRHDLLFSEKAFAYKMQLEAIKKKAGRPKQTDENIGEINSGQVGPNLFSADIVGKENGESSSQIKRYIRLTELLTPLLDMVDSRKISLVAGVNISYLSESYQNMLLEYLQANNVQNVTIKQSELLKSCEAMDFIILNNIFDNKKSDSVSETLGKVSSVSFKIPTNLLNIDGSKIKELLKDEQTLIKLSELINTFLEESV